MQSLSIPAIINVERETSQRLDILDSLENKRKFWQSMSKVKGMKTKAATYLKTIETLIEQHQAALSNSTQYAKLFDLVQQDEQECISQIMLILIDAIKYFNTSEHMDKEQIQETAYLVAGTMTDLTLEDVAYCIHQAKVGEHGKVYNRIDGGVIMNWLQDYRNKKRAKLAEIEQSKHAHSKVDHNIGKQTAQELERYRKVFQPPVISKELKGER